MVSSQKLFDIAKPVYRELEGIRFTPEIICMQLDPFVSHLTIRSCFSPCRYAVADHMKDCIVFKPTILTCKAIPGRE